MDEHKEKAIGGLLILTGISMWTLLPPRGISFTRVLTIHMSLVIPGVYLFERQFIRYIIHKIRRKK